MDNLWTQAPAVPPLGGDEIIEVLIEGGDDSEPRLVNGVLEIPTADGGVTVVMNPDRDRSDAKFDDNLAMDMDAGELARIGERLLEGIAADDQSRGEWLTTRERAIDLLGVKLEEPRGDVGQSSAPLEGMATVRHPVLLEATLRSQATACGELLPAGGPVKIQDVNPASTELTQQLAEALEKDLNNYLTNRAKEYYPDTRRALFWSSLGGSSFKKVYSCPLRERPVSETVDAKDLIVSSAATDLQNANRVTHVIKMRQSVMKRMQVANVYRDVPLSHPTSQPSTLDQKEAQTEGISLRIDRPEDQPYTVYECYCELDLEEFAPKQFKGKAIPLPYRVTIEKDSRQVLEIRRNWNKDDERCMARRVFVKYPYVEGMGIYGLGLLHILGNPSSALTAAWRLMLDNGMFANFPGFVVDKAASRQLQNDFRVGPGQGMVLDFQGKGAANAVGQLPYRDLGPVWVQFINHMEEVVGRLGGAAEIGVGEGKQDAPVGTTLALIEQATKIESEVHKGLHAAQAEEFQLLKERFKEDPDALFRHVPKSETLKIMMARHGLKPIADQEEADEKRRQALFIAALNDVELVPQADPNSPSHTHRILKWQGLKQMQMTNPAIDGMAVDKLGIRLLGFDPAPLMKAPVATPQAPDPKLLSAIAALLKAQAEGKKIEYQSADSLAKYQDADAQRESDERIAAMNLHKEALIHSDDMTIERERTERALIRDVLNDVAGRQHDKEKHIAGIAAQQYRHEGGIVSAHVKQERDHAHARAEAEASRRHALDLTRMKPAPTRQ